VDDSRATLEYCVQELMETNAPAEIAVAVVHNKLKTKKGKLPENVTYFAGENVEDAWNCYPWDAAAYGHTIFEHEKLAIECHAKFEQDFPGKTVQPATPATPAATTPTTTPTNPVAKQDPLEKRRRQAAADGKVYFSYAHVHAAMSSLAEKIRAWNPDVMVAIGGGGFIPARMLRTEIKVPILAVSLELYDDATKTARKKVVKKQWFDDTSGVGKLVRGMRVLVVDEVDDSRATLEYCVQELMETNAPAEIAVAVVHNKLKKKKGTLPDNVTYFAGDNVEDAWNCYPWDAAAYSNTIFKHEKLAIECHASDCGKQ